jgi:hypothetical protein
VRVSSSDRPAHRLPAGPGRRVPDQKQQVIVAL